MTTFAFAAISFIALALVGHFATPPAQRRSDTTPLALVRRGLSATFAAGRMSWAARQTIA